MAIVDSRADQDTSHFQRLGLAVAGAFYLASVGYVLLVGDAGSTLAPDVKTITFAHWQLEDGYREGVDEAIRRFETLKAEQGQKVKVIQSTVPWRGYSQWFLTQLIGGNPADLMELIGSSQLYHRYFVPLSPYIDKPNPFNQSTVLEGMPWRDTYVDDMEGSQDNVYAEYFGVGHMFHTYRLFVNVDLLEKATGSRQLPRDLTEWLDACAKLKAYGRNTGTPIIPIGVRGFDKGTLNHLFRYYFSQMTGNLNDAYSRFGGRVSVAGVLEQMNTNPQIRERVLAVIDVIQEIGRNFGVGFTAMDLEQTKFLFYSGTMGFFPEGTWNAWSMVNNSPFEVAIIPIPPLGHTHKYSKYFTGKITEAGVRVGGKIGIPKATKHFDLALEFLQFFTSYEINQMAMMDYTKWPPAVKHAEYKGILKAFQPQMEGNLSVPTPFSRWGQTSHRKYLECLEQIITNDIDNPGRYFLDTFKKNKDILRDEGAEYVKGYYRSQMDTERYRSQFSVGLLRGDLTSQQADTLRLRLTITSQSAGGHTVGHLTSLRYYQQIDDM